MANFTITISGSFVSGTTARDGFYINAGRCTVLGLDGDDAFNVANSGFGHFLDAGAGNDSFDFGTNCAFNIVRGMRYSSARAA